MKYFSLEKMHRFGIKSIDDEHENLLKHILKLESLASQQTKNNETQKMQAIQSSLEFFYSHFFDEEKVMKEFQYPKLDDQVKEHNQCLAVIYEFMNRYKNKKENVLPELTNFLRSWLETHTSKSDTEFVNFITTRKSK